MMKKVPKYVLKDLVSREAQLSRYIGYLESTLEVFSSRVARLARLHVLGAPDYVLENEEVLVARSRADIRNHLAEIDRMAAGVTTAREAVAGRQSSEELHEHRQRFSEAYAAVTR
jgi:hypothetical protein